ncbi:hypothetical protein HR51_32720 [Burkholderia cepacia]|nr:hypothetical protein HR51_32720 [Burkholderia cepacia]
MRSDRSRDFDRRAADQAGGPHRCALRLPDVVFAVPRTSCAGTRNDSPCVSPRPPFASRRCVDRFS